MIQEFESYFCYIMLKYVQKRIKFGNRLPFHVSLVEIMEKEENIQGDKKEERQQL